MYTLDIGRFQEKQFYSLGGRFCGSDPDGHRIGFTNAFMTVDGKPFFAISGEMHFSRVSEDQWEDSIVKMKCGGINILSTYVFWIVHEEEEGVFRFDGERDLDAFLGVCEKHKMWVILRVGPFAHGEMRNGGLPDWLYGKPYDVRENSPGFLDAVRKYFRAIGGQVRDHLFSRGGCVVGTQIENEYRHSSAPWEMAAGGASEWVNGGHSGMEYMLALKKIMREEGIDTPFYTATAWGGALTPVDEALPLWGGYSYQPWLFYQKPGIHPATPEYIYRDNHNSAVRKEYNFEPSYDPESRPYACCEMMGGMMCSYKYRFRLDMRAVDALANVKLGSGCTLLGYYMYRGGTNPTGKRTPYLNEGQVPRRSYDYQAAIGEFGQIRESYGRLAAVHMLCGLFSPFLEETTAVLPGHLRDISPQDTGPLRFSVRVKGDSGFLFICNFQDHAPMRDRHGDEVALKLKDRDIVFRFDIAAGENAILPFNMRMGDITLEHATAQPLAHLGRTWFFLCPDGMKSVFYFDGREYCPGEGGSLRIGGQIITCLSREDSLGFRIFKDRAFLCSRPLLYDGREIYVQMASGTADVRMWSEERMAFVSVQRIESGRSARPLAWRRTGTGRYVISLPETDLTQHRLALLRIRYRGDTASAFAGGQMISDNFCNGDPWDIRLDPYAKELLKEPPVICITPVKRNVCVDASAMAGLTERAETEEMEMLDAFLLLVDEFPVHI